MVDCIIKRAELKAKLSSLLEFLTGNERAFETDNLAQKIPQHIKELLKLSVTSHA